MNTFAEIDKNLRQATRSMQHTTDLATAFAYIAKGLNREIRTLDKPAVVAKIAEAERKHDAAVLAQDLGTFFIKKWRGRLEFNDHGTVAKQMRKQGIPLNEALLLLFGKPERFAHLAKGA